MAERDTQFAGFAKALWQEIADNLKRHSEQHLLLEAEALRIEEEKIITQRARDLVQHAIGYNLEYLHECGRSVPALNDRMVNAVPDLPELPPVQTSLTSGTSLMDSFSLTEITSEPENKR